VSGKQRRYRVEALERFLMRTHYYVDAKSPEEAERICKGGAAAYEDSEFAEGDNQWIETVEVELIHMLNVGDQVHWQDPDDDLCSGVFVVRQIKSETAVIGNDKGSVAEVPFCEITLIEGEA